MLFKFILHLHELLDFHALFHVFFSLALVFSDAFELEALSFLGSEFILFQTRVGKVVLLLSFTNTLPFFLISLGCLYIAFTFSSLSNLIVLHIAFDETLSLLLSLFSTLCLTKGSTIPGLLTLGPVLNLLTEAHLLVPLHLVVSLLALELSFIVFVLVNSGVINKHIFTVEDGDLSHL